ncbi:MAG: hypothetical protein ACQERD_10245 [Campylobacterota bacterium]
MAEMILASFLKIWHLIPIIIGIILFRKFINYKDKKRIIKTNEENEKKGLNIKLRTAKKYEDFGYSVIVFNDDEKKESGIDLLSSKDDKRLLMKCTNKTKSKSITSEDIKAFIDDATKYTKTNDMKKSYIEFRYVVLYPEILSKSAIKILKDDSFNCKYTVL